MSGRTRKSARGATPASLDDLQEIVAPTSTPRRTNVLPPIASRKSNAYGSGISVLPREWNTSLHKADLSEALDIIVSSPTPQSPSAAEPSGDAEANTQKSTSTPSGGRRTRARATKTPRSTRTSTRRVSQSNSKEAQQTPSQLSHQSFSTSFSTESAIFNDVHHQPPAIHVIDPPESSVAESQQQQFKTQKSSRASPLEAVPEEFNSQRRDREALHIQQVTNLISNLLSLIDRNLTKILHGLLGLVLSAFLVFVLLSALSDPTKIRSYGFDMTHNIGQFVPYSVAHPFNYLFSPDDVNDLQRRLSMIEYDIVYLKSRDSLHHEAVQTLEGVLPEFISLKRDSTGSVQIPTEFWHALRSKIETDQGLARSIESKISSDVQFGQNTMPSWEEFLAANKDKVDTWQRSLADGNWDRYLEDAFKGDVLLSKREFLALMNMRYFEIKDMTNAEINKLRSHFESEIRNVQYDSDKKIQQANLNAQRQSISLSQLLGYSNANVQKHLSMTAKRTDYLSQHLGAVVDPHLTSPTHQYQEKRAGPLHRNLLSAMGRGFYPPKPPNEALRAWEEHGDCWCSETASFATGGTRLTVLLPRTIYAQDVIIEHIPSTAGLDPRSAPREMELLILVDGWDQQRAIAEYTDKYLNWDEPDNIPSYKWYRVASWTFDMSKGDNIQAFSIPIPLKELGVTTNKVMVRAKSNWGKSDYTCFYRVRLYGEQEHTDEELENQDKAQLFTY